MTRGKGASSAVSGWLAAVVSDPDSTSAQCYSRRIALYLRAGIDPMWSSSVELRFRAYCEDRDIDIAVARGPTKRWIRWALLLTNTKAVDGGQVGSQLCLFDME